MGKKNRHSKDRLYISASEWSKEYGGKKSETNLGNQTSRTLPFDHCALSLSPYETPVCTPDGVIFDLVNLLPFIRKHKCNPITGESMTSQDIIRLNMEKNSEGKWHCPVTCKVFTNNSYVVAIKTTGTVLSYDAVLELNIKPKNFVDLITNEPFNKNDIITLLNSLDPIHSAKRDISNFVHLQQVRKDHQDEMKDESKIRSNPVSAFVMKVLEARANEDPTIRAKKRALEVASISEEYTDDVKEFLAIGVLTCDVNPGQNNTSGQASSSLTSTVMTQSGSSATRLASAEEFREARWRKLRQLDKKGYVQLQTTHGNINIEIHCNWIHRTSYNFIELCRREYYDECVFHRLVPGFCLQTGDPTGTGGGGESVWNGKAFRDEHDSRLLHDSRGVVSMANSGPNSNQSQFFISLDKAPHLDYKHTIFGRVVGGMATVDRIEAIGSDKKEKPLQEVKLLKAIVFTNPIEEADRSVVEDVKRNMKKRLESTAASALPQRPPASSTSASLTSSASISASVTNIDNKSSSSVSAPTKSSFSFDYTTSSAAKASGPSTLPTNTTATNSTSVSAPKKDSANTTTTSVISSNSNQPSNDAAVEAFLKSQAQRLSGSVEPEKRQKSGFGNFSAW